MRKKGDVMHTVFINLILIVILFVIFFFAMEAKIGSRGVKQQVLEKELALLIDAAEPGFSFEILKKNDNGLVNSVIVKDSRIFVVVDELPSLNGYPYFSLHEVFVDEEDDRFIVKVE